jgi:hypothetical protein
VSHRNCIRVSTDLIKPNSIEEILRDGKENGSRLTLLMGLTAVRESRKKHFLAWAKAQKELVLKHLRPPTLEDVHMLVHVARDRLLTFLEM